MYCGIVILLVRVRVKIRASPHVGKKTGHYGLDMEGCMHYIFLEIEVRKMC